MIDLLKLQQEKLISQEQLARECGCTLGAMHNILHRLSTPRITTAVKLAEVFGVSVGELWPGEVKDGLQ